MKRALPGPYTFILPGNNNLPKEFKKKKTVGIRVPDNSIVKALVEELGNPIVSTSIRDDDDVLEYTTDPELIYEKWDNLVDVVIDGGYGGNVCLLYTSDAADDSLRVDLGGRRSIKK